MEDEIYEDPPYVFKFPVPPKLNRPILRITDGRIGYTKEDPIITKCNIEIDMETRITRLLLLPAAVCDAMLESMCCRGGASIDLAPAIRTMPIAPAACSSRSIATLNVAHFRAATAMPCTQSS